MTQKKRDPVTAELLVKMGSELVEMPVSADKAAAHAGIFELIMGQVEGLRTLPIKDIEPATVFSPVSKRDAGHDD